MQHDLWLFEYSQLNSLLTYTVDGVVPFYPTQSAWISIIRCNIYAIYDSMGNIFSVRTLVES